MFDFIYSILLWCAFFFLVISVYVLYMSWTHNTFKKMGVKGPPPSLILGNAAEQHKMGFMETDETNMKKYGKVWGIYEVRQPNLYITDEEMLKEILVKKFWNFPNRRSLKGLAGYFEHNLSMVEDDHWKNMRNMMTPTFSSGKLKKMTYLIQKASGILIENIENKCSENKEIEMKGIFGSYTMDIICSTAFGINVNSQEDPKHPFVQNAAKMIDFKFDSPVFLIAAFFPFLLKPICRTFGITIFDEEPQIFFRDVVTKELNNRQKEREDFVDFLQLMIEAHDDNPDSTNKKGLSSKEIIGNSLLFFSAGYETTATTLCMLSYNMALYPDAQTKLYEEVEKEIGDEPLDYDNINKLEYLDMCINETLRLFPPSVRIERACAKDTVLNGLHIPKGMIVTVPIWAMHRSPDIWSEPETFDPERFSKENKSKISPYHFMPFGYGPRNCIGTRLALLEIKIAFAEVIRKFRFSTGAKIRIPPTLKEMGLISPTEIWLKVEKR